MVSDPAALSVLCLPTCFPSAISFLTLFPLALQDRNAYKCERNINQLHPGATQANPGVNPDYLRPYKGIGPIHSTNNDGRSRHNRLQLEDFRRFTNGFGFSAANTYSKLWDDGSSHRDLLPNAYDASKMWGPSSQDRHHVMSLVGVYELPFMNSGSFGKVQNKSGERGLQFALRYSF